jgi:peptide/nickel transport system ATP-binding protein
MTEPLLSVEGLRVRFPGDGGTIRAVDGVDFEVRRGETVCLVGESGAGKTVLAESLTGLIDAPPADVDGEVRLDGRDVLSMPESELESIRGGRVGHVFQDPRGAFTPVYTVGWQLVEAIRLHDDASRAAARRRAIDLLDRVDIPDPAARVDDYPHEFSGGQLQRVGIAAALAGEPDLIVADEPTTGLDATVQMGILRLLGDVQATLEAGVLLITHDLGVVAEVADRVIVLYAGSVVESGDVYDVFESPAHPYTRALFSCLPGRGDGATAIEGSPPAPDRLPDGCRFHPRCRHAVEGCRRDDRPPLYPVDGADAAGRDATDVGAGSRVEDADVDHRASCVHYGPDGDPAVLDADAATDAAPGRDDWGADEP